MKGVAVRLFLIVLKLFEYLHEIPAYNIWEAAYRLQQNGTQYWPRNCVCFTFVDPGVGSERICCIKETKVGILCYAR